MQNVQEIWRKCKSLAEDAISEWGLVALVFLVGLCSFGLGRLSAIEETKPLISIGEAQSAALAPAIALGGEVVASRKGRTYHFPWCSGARTISEATKIWFKSEEAARKAGFVPAKNCKGLK